MKATLAIIIVAAIISFGNVTADIPRALSYQGVLADAGGAAVADGDYNLTFKLYDVPSGGLALWTENQTVQVRKGIFNVELGENGPIMLAFDRQYYLGISVQGGDELTLRTRLVSSPYSYSALTSSGVLGVTNIIPANGNVGIGTLTPQVKLDVLGAARVESFIMPTNAASGRVLASNELGYGAWQQVTSDMIADGAIAGSDIGQNGAGIGNVLKWTGTSWQAEGDLVGGAGDGYSLEASDGDPQDVVRVDADGNVDIGAGSPMKLDVQGPLNVGAPAGMLGYDVNFYGQTGGSQLSWDASKFALRAGVASGGKWDDANVGSYSMALGDNPSAPGEASFASGCNTLASGLRSTAMGAFCTASGNNSFAAGNQATASGVSALCLGDHATSSNDHSVAIGYFAEASGADAIAAGYYADASGPNATAIGYYAAGTNGGTAIGAHTASRGNGSIALGRNLSADTTNAIVIGAGPHYAMPLINATENSLVVGFNTTTPTFFVGGANNRVGVGTITPSYEFQVGAAGDGSEARANAWNTFSSRQYKRDILPLRPAEYERVLRDIQGTEVVRFTYANDEMRTHHIGVIAEEAPRDIVTPDGTGVSLADYCAFLLAAVKAQQERIETLEEDVRRLERERPTR